MVYVFFERDTRISYAQYTDESYEKSKDSFEDGAIVVREEEISHLLQQGLSLSDCYYDSTTGKIQPIERISLSVDKIKIAADGIDVSTILFDLIEDMDVVFIYKGYHAAEPRSHKIAKDIDSISFCSELEGPYIIYLIGQKSISDSIEIEVIKHED